MLPRSRRLSRRLLSMASQKKSTLFTEGVSFAFYVCENTSEVSRFSVIIAKKVEKKAVHRNKLRRQVYEIIRKHIDHIQDGFYGVIYIKKGFKELTFQEKEKRIVYVLKKSFTL